MSTMLGPLILLLATQPRLSETIVVTAERIEQPWREGAAAVTVLRGEELARLPVQNLGNALRYVPGLQIVAVNPGAPPMISSRGFFGAGEVEYMQLVIDGVPVADVESGLADWRSIPIDAIDRIEVLRGPGSSLFGDTALGGVVQVFRRRSSGASISAASFGSMSVHASYATGGGRPATQGFISASAVRTDGFRDHSSTRELFGNVALTRGPWQFSLDASQRDREDPGARSADEMRSDPFGSHPLFAGDREETRRMRAAIRHRGPLDLSLYVHDRHTDQTRTLLLAPEFGDRATRAVDTLAIGASIARTIRGTRGSIVFGADGAHESLESEYRSAATPVAALVREPEARASGTRAATGVAALLERRRAAMFVSGEWRATPSVRLAAGARWDAIDDAFESIDASDRTLSPRIAASFDLGTLTTYVQLARAFKAPTLDQRFDQRLFPDFAGGTFTISNPELESQRARSIEAGLRGAQWEIVAYQMHVENEIDFDVRTFRYANIGSSRHRGVEAMWRNAFLSASYAWTRVGDGDAQLKNIAEHVLRAGLDFSALVDVQVGVEHSANRWLDDENRFPLDDATVVDVRVSRTFATVTAALEANNLFDERFAPLGFLLGDAPYYYPAAPRSVALTIRWKGTPP